MNTAGRFHRTNKLAFELYTTFIHFMKSTSNLIILSVFVLILAGSDFESEVAAREIPAARPAVWVTDNMQRVKLDEPAGKANHIELYAARGEYEVRHLGSR